MNGPGWGLPPYEDDEPRPGRLPVDQVQRLRRFQAARPEVDIERPDITKGESWRASVAGRQIASDVELRGLLDQLDRMYPGDAS